ncbi:hypothetical protein [Cellulomonas sp. NPDC089187]|uniref:hypothetical protein n=1 Tax=Cellulomonas sp. NPDC089187 TaxID=3154970 RepID=UPI00342D97FF
MTGWDEGALTLLVGPGVVRRARRVVDSGAVIAGPDGTVLVGEMPVRTRGAVEDWSCPCPTAGVCVHVIAAALVGESDRAVPDIDPVRVQRTAGRAAVRAARHLLREGPVVLSTTSEPGRLRIETRHGPVLLVDGAVLSDLTGAERAAVHLAALSEVVPGWTWIPGTEPVDPDAVTAAERKAAAAVAAEVRSLVSRGIGRLVPESVDPLREIGLRARAVGLPRLSRQVARCAATLMAVADGQDDGADLDPHGELAECHLVAEAIAARAVGEPLGALRGQSRRQTDHAADREVVPLGASWWTARTGARGVTAVFWDRAEGVMFQVRAARAAHADPGFQRIARAVLLWGATVPHLLAGPFLLRDLRITEDGEVSPTGARVDRAGVDAATDQELRSIGCDDWSQLPRPVRDTAVLLSPSSVGAVQVDEVAQELLWPVTDRQGRVIALRLPVSAERQVTADALLRYTEGTATIAHVLVLARDGRWEPVSVVVDRAAGPVVISLDFAPQRRVSGARLDALRERFRGILDRREHVPVPISPPDPIVDLCHEVIALTDDVAFTGVTTLGEHRHRRLVRATRQADALAWGLLSDAMTRWVADPMNAGALLRVRALAARMLGLAR